MTAIKKKVFVGMSGGVDSSVVAAVLLEKGYDVEGITLLLTDAQKEYGNSDAQAVADVLGIPLHMIDIRKEFSEKVISYFVSEYRQGRTPNPCVVCNQTIKFGLMLDKAIEMGADYIATGHYAKIEEKEGRFLLKAADSAKDQSYFLYRLNQNQLSHIMFPLADMEKTDTRELARKFNLPVAEKSDSQEICFVPNDDYVSFLKDYANITSLPGDFVNLEGKKIGEHKGIINYTIGQRKGLGAFGEPMFVTKIDAKTNEVVLAPKGYQQGKEFIVENLCEPIKEETVLDVKIRYRASKVPATVIPISEDTVKVVLHESQRAVTPGQSAVFYSDDTVISGGFISTEN